MREPTFELRSSGKRAGKTTGSWEQLFEMARLYFGYSGEPREPLVVDIVGLIVTRPHQVIRVTFETLQQRPRSSWEERRHAETEKVDFDPSDLEPAKQLLGHLWHCNEYYLTHCPDPARCSRHREL